MRRPAITLALLIAAAFAARPALAQTVEGKPVVSLTAMRAAADPRLISSRRRNRRRRSRSRNQPFRAGIQDPASVRSCSSTTNG